MGVKVVEEDMVRFIQQLESRVAAEVQAKHSHKVSLGPDPEPGPGPGGSRVQNIS